MISLNTLIEEIQKQIKASGDTEFNFHIVADTGKFKKSESHSSQILIPLAP